VPKDTAVIRLDGKYITPGLVDGHIHFFQSGGLYTRPDAIDLRHRRPYDEHIEKLRGNVDEVFRRYLRCGVTTVIDTGGPFWSFEVRKKARRSSHAPNVFVAGPLIASYSPKELSHEDQAIIRVDSRKEAVSLVRKQAAKKTDLIKVWYVVSKKLGLGLEEFWPVYEAVVSEARRRDLPVWVHATELETARRAVKGGADVLVHMVRDKPVDASFISQVKKRGVIVIPTLWVFQSYAAVFTKQLDLLAQEHLMGDPHIIGTLYDMHELSPKELGPRQKKLLAANKPIEPSPTLLRNLKKLHDAGVTIALGTDAGNIGVLHGPSVFHEMLLMSKAGLTNHEILVAATLNGAKLLGNEKRLGSVDAGKIADLVVLEEDPLKDILNTAKIHMVIKDGNVHYPQKLIPRTPESLAQLQLNAYNARDIEVFLEAYAPDVEAYAHPDELLFKGKEAMRRRYAAFFNRAKNLHCRLKNRMIMGDTVIDHEEVTGIPGKERVRAIAIYRIKNRLIQKIWFIKP
jgi:imidazolonepropionase-like amidohydrolase